MSHAQFVHLHNHSYFSLLDGALPMSKFIDKAVEYKLPALALTDHGNLFGGLEFYQKCLAKGIKPILGCEMYIASNGSMKDRDPRKMGDGGYNHLILLAQNHKGYQNLCHLISSSYLEGFYYKPRIDKEILSQYNEGLVALGACLKGEVPNLLMQGDFEGAKEAAAWYKKLFGDRFYLEIMRFGLPEEEEVNPGLVKIGKELGIKLVATNDCHYMSQSDSSIHDALICIQTGTTVSETNRMKFSTDQFYFKSPDEMAELFRDMPEVLTNTLDVAEKCNLELDLKTYHFPQFHLPEGKQIESYFEEQSRAGFLDRFGDLDSEQKKVYEERLDIELDLIKKMGFAGYFLIVADFINWAKSKNIPVGPGRGSAAGSLVAFCMKITDVDPIPNKLFFERFLNPERVSMPDMDIDFCMRRRGEVIDYVREKYGFVSQIITFGKMKARGVVRDVGRVLGVPYGDVDKIAKLIPAAIDMTLAKALQVEPQLKKIAKDDDRIAHLLDVAKGLEGFPRHASTHAAGVVMSDKPLDTFLPLYVGQHDEIVTQFDMKSVEKVGLVKFDFLGLKTLTVMHDAISMVKERTGVDVNLSKLSLDDKLVYDRLSSGETAGIFQLESSGMTDLVVKLKPSCFADIVALVALFRPGPLGSGMVDDFINRKHGRTKIEYELPQLEPILKDTYGVIVYQEQVMQIASALAGFTLGDADLLRRAMGKKNADEMAKQRVRFLEGAAKNKIPSAKAEKIFDLMAEFAEYGFNKCVVGDTELVDAVSGEIFTVGELYASKMFRRTLSCASSWKVGDFKISDVVSNGRKKTFELTTKLGLKIRATGNHPFLTLAGWKKLDDLSVGSRIAAPRSLPVNCKGKLLRHEIVTLAWLISEGNTCHPSSLYFYNNDRECVEDFVSNVERFPETNARVYKRRGKIFEVCVNKGQTPHVPWNAKSRVERDICGAYKWASSVGIVGKSASNKEIPSDIFRLNNKQIALFIGRLWSGDGFVFGKNNTVPFYATSSEKLVRQLQHLLLRLGIVSRIASKSFKYRGGAKKGYALYLIGEGSVEGFIKTVCPNMIGREDQIRKLEDYIAKRESCLASKDTVPWEVKSRVRELKLASDKTWNDIEAATGLSMKEFIGGPHENKRGFRRKTIKQIGQYFGAKDLVALGESDVFWDEVASIRSCGMEETFDITVDGSHNFVANGLIVHNSHSAAYALISYQTAYLKFHHQTEYMAALLTSEIANTDKLLFYMNACRESGITVRPPDVNQSMIDFAVVDENEIRFGLAAVKGVGAASVENMIATRKSEGLFKSLDDFCARVDSRRANKRVMESLVKCGAFDSLGVHRAALFATLDVSMQRAQSVQRDREVGQSSLFDLAGSDALAGSDSPNYADFAPWSEHQLLANEKESLGFYISGHPLVQFSSILQLYANATTDVLKDKPDKSEVKIGGVVASMREITTKKGDRMAFVTLEDLKGMADVIVFPELYAKSMETIKSDQPIFVVGNVDVDEERAKILASDIFLLNEAPARLTKSVHFKLAASDTDPKQLQALKQLLGRFKGDCKAFLHMTIPGKSETVMELPNEFRVAPSQQLVASVEKIFGHNVTYFTG